MRHAPPGRELVLSPCTVRLRLEQEAQMTVYIGVDLHVRTQTVCWMDTADGEIHHHTLDHARDDLRAFYAQFPAPAVVGVESSGYSLWFHQLIEQAGHRLLVGHAYAIRQFARRRQKNNRRDAELLLDLLRRDEFPIVHRPAPSSQDTPGLRPPAAAGAGSAGDLAGADR